MHNIFREIQENAHGQPAEGGLIIDTSYIVSHSMCTNRHQLDW